MKGNKVYKINVIINLRAIRNFILLNIIFRFKIRIRVKIKPYELLIINKESINNNKGIINIKIKRLIIEMLKGYLEII